MAPDAVFEMAKWASSLKIPELDSTLTHVIEQLISRGFESASLHCLLGSLLEPRVVDTPNAGLSVECFHRALEMDPDSVEARIGLSNWLARGVYTGHTFDDLYGPESYQKLRGNVDFLICKCAPKAGHDSNRDYVHRHYIAHPSY